MKRLLLFIILLSTALVARADSPATIVFSEGVDAGFLEITPAEQYSVDLTDYPVPTDTKLLILHVRSSPMSHYYFQPLTADTMLYTLSAQSLKASEGSPTFAGLQAGDRAFLILGEEVQPGSIDMGVIHNYASFSLWVD